MNRQLFRTRVKFDGFTRAGDVRLAGELGADAISFEFVDGWPRRVRVEEARIMRQALAPLVDSVAVFRDNPVDEIRDVVKQLRPAMLEFHGAEEDTQMRAFGIPYSKALYRADFSDGIDPRALHARYPNAAVFIFHGSARDAEFKLLQDWSWLPSDMTKPVMIGDSVAGDNVFDLLTGREPWGVAVREPVEVSPGIKDGELMREFMRAARKADCHEDPDSPCT